ncbi:PH domain-containing protein [Kineosporia sp. NBRC 101677]|uniref:PH domain-containing protein n=1 Tax=Kineosporia sp. NBRC 101677 TaxID=3032197 RepID=UPI002557C727|nr:PH domain-containing protein [Kineosporia sp. NBRC 101677]
MTDRVAELHRPFVSRRGRLAAWVMGVGQALAIGAWALLLPWSGPDPVGIWDRLGMIGVAGFIGWGMSRFGGVRATPGPDGLTVRNILLTRKLSWSEIEDVHYAGSDPWVTLATADGDPVAVMAIQRADGAPAQAEAERLATLVAYHHRS